MKNNLRLEVQNAGKVMFDITKFVKKNIGIESTQAFQHFKGFFQIMGKGNRKAGSVQLQMGCQFDPEIAAKQLGQEALQQIIKSQVQNCPASKLQVLQCCGHCQCVCPKPPSKVRVVKAQKENKNDDPRIPHSLDTKSRQQKQFNAQKYQQKQQQKSPVIKPKQNQKKIEIKGNQVREISQKQRIIKQNELNGKQNNSQQFPQVPKILTYSNLRLNYNDSQLKQQMEKEDQDIQQIGKQKGNPSMKNINLGRKEPNKIQQLKNIAESVEDRIQIQPKPQISKQQLMRQFYGAENSPFKSNYEPIVEKQLGDSYSQNKNIRSPSDREMLSRVVNLDRQLDKASRIKPPPLLPVSVQQSQRDTTGYNFRKFEMQTRPAKKSNLMLSLFIQMNKSKLNLPTKQNFYIAYRPYGQKQRLTLGPNLPDQIHILSIVGETEVRKMSKTPFIIQFWTSAQNKFIGLIRIDLSKIKHGFLLQDRLNQISIKTNILPTVIQRGQIKILDLFDKQVGNCQLYAAIGTSNQLNTYLNQKQSLPNPQKVIIQQKKPKIIQDPQKEGLKQPYKKKDLDPEIEHQHEHSLDNKSLLISYTAFLATLYSNNNRVIDQLNQLMNKRYANRQQFNELGKSIGLQSLNFIYDMHKNIKILDETNGQKDHIDFHAVAESFDDFMEIKHKMRDEYLLCAKTVKNLFSDPSIVLQKIKQYAPMHVINRKKLQQIMLKYTKYSPPVNEYLNKLSQYIPVDLLSSALSSMSKSAQIPELSQFSKQYLYKLITDRIAENAVKSQFAFNSDQFENELDEDQKGRATIWDFYNWLKRHKFISSLWLLFYLIQCLDKNQQLYQEGKLSKHNIKKYLQRFNNKQPEIPKRQVQVEPEVEPKKPQPIKPQPNQQNGGQQPPQINNTSAISNNANEVPAHPIPQPAPIATEPAEKYFKHLFSINPIEVTLDHPIKGNCQVIYEFPFDEEQVKSKSFMTSLEKHKYPIKMYGNHGFTIREHVSQYIADNSVKFYVKIDKRIQYQGALPSDELIIDPNTQQDKIIPLFNQRNEGIAGKIRLNVSYQQSPATENNLGKQTTYQLFLPKSGYVNYAICCQFQSSKIRSQLNIKQEFYIALVLDIFHHNASLRTQFPPCSSKLYADTAEQGQLTGSIKLSLSPVVLQYFKNLTARVSLNIVYYSKDSGNFQRKQIPYAIIQLPLINVIKAQGIHGDYAFKNKLGMFVTLANCTLKYEKDPVNKIKLRQQNDKHMLSYWLLLNFLQFISFEQNKFSWIKIQFVLKGRKYTTQKLALQPYSINPLNKSPIFLKFTQEQFVDTKVIPLTILTNTSQKLAIDINLKSIGKDILHRKYSINNQYFVVVDRDSKPTKMRLAIKTYCFRGGPLLANFVNSIYQYGDVQVFDEMDMPDNIDNYDEMLNIFKNKLKLSNKSLQQAINQLDLGKNKQKLNLQFFTNRTYYKLDFTPILAQNEEDIDFICQQLPTEASKQEIVQYLNNNKIKLINFREEFLDRFSFKELNKLRFDKNVQFLGIQGSIDLISFIRKIKLLDGIQNASHRESSLMQEKNLQLSILQGSNFQHLYNGIKPNSSIRIPQLGIQSQISHRNSNPFFNETFVCQIEKDNYSILRNLKVQVYHCTGNDDEDMENIMIGEGTINIQPGEIQHGARIVKISINSLMSTRMKANLNVKLALVEAKRKNKLRDRDDSSQHVEQSAQASRLGEILHDIRQQMAYKNKLFQSSDQEY